MGTTILYWDKIGIMENKMETTIFHRDYVGNLLGLYWDNIWVVVKIMGPFWIPIIIRPLISRVLRKGP